MQVWADVTQEDTVWLQLTYNGVVRLHYGGEFLGCRFDVGHHV